MLDLTTDDTRLTEAQRRAGVDAALSVFDQYQQDPESCYRVYGYLIRGPLNLFDSDETLIEVWEEAESAAIEAACPDGYTADVSLVFLREERPAA